MKARRSGALSAHANMRTCNGMMACCCMTRCLVSSCYTTTAAGMRAASDADGRLPASAVTELTLERLHIRRVEALAALTSLRVCR